MITNLLLSWIYKAITHEKRDPLFNEAVKVVAKYDQIGVSHIQKELTVGFARGEKILNQLHHAGIVSLPTGLRAVFRENAKEYIKNPKEYEKKRKKEADEFLNQKQ